MDGLTLIRHVRPQFYLSLYFVKPSPAIRSSVFPIKRLTPLMTMMMTINYPESSESKAGGPQSPAQGPTSMATLDSLACAIYLAIFLSVGMRLVLLVTRLTSQLDHKSSFL
jgi:hypothetical protein